MDFFLDIITSGTKKNDIVKNHERIAKQVIISTNGSFVERLPVLKSTFITVQGNEIQQGTILKRPIYKLLSHFDVKHAGYVYGTGIDGKMYIIDKDATAVVQHTEFYKFMKGFSLDYLELLSPPDDFDIQKTLERSKEIESLPYSYKGDNCQRFVFYSVLGENRSPLFDFVKENKTKFGKYSKYF